MSIRIIQGDALEYGLFIESKSAVNPCAGFNDADVHPVLYDFQSSVVKWALRKGRSAIFEDCGLGKTLQQIEWARNIVQKSGNRVLIVAPLCVAEQTIDEGKKVGVDIVKVDRPGSHPIQITNYEKLHHFIGADYSGIVLDESSILKSLDGKTRTMILKEFTGIPYRLACTATPSPNDISEIGNHAEFLGLMKREEMLATFFVHDEQAWRVKGHAENEFYRWMSTWCVFAKKPSDMGYDDRDFVLPRLDVIPVITDCPEIEKDGMLFGVYGKDIHGRRKARRNSIDNRVNKAVEMIGNEPDRSWLVWCGLNDEGRIMKGALPGSLLIEGSDTDQWKMEAEKKWRSGAAKVLITKPSMFGFGMNWQHCSRMIFLGIDDSYERFYQAIRRAWRFGQTNTVKAWIVISDAETDVLKNIESKHAMNERMVSEVVKHMADFEIRELNGAKMPRPEVETDDYCDAVGRYRMMMGDCVTRIKEVKDHSVGLSVFSPPFASLYTYTDLPNDMGNSKDYEQFFVHYKYLIPELMRVTMPGRRCCIHVQQVAMLKGRDGFIGWRDFRADVVRSMVEGGWIYDGEVVIDKDPQAQAIRTKSKALLFVQMHKDASWSRPAMADYILLFRAPGDNPQPIKPDLTNDEWIEYARPIWYGIKESDTLNFREAREDKDERHICPLQLGTIERVVRLWSNPGDLVLSPFAGIGSEGYVSLKHGRKFIGIELKPSYWRTALKNLKSAVRINLLDYAENTPTVAGGRRDKEVSHGST